MRMAQPHAGEGYGQHFPLRPGAEVLVGFLCGDPDRPVILGAVPNPIQASPVIASKDSEPLDVNRIKTRSGVIIEISDGPTKAR
jgi:type VI secretion system secreted protein VgrG